MLHLSNPFPRLRAWLSKPAFLRRPSAPKRPARPTPPSPNSFGPQVAMRLYRAQRAAQRSQGQ